MTIGEHGYWDGLFSDNPPVEELIRPRSVGPENVPEEIWVIKINPTTYKSVPDRPETPIRIPKAFSTDPDRPYYIPWIEMPAEVQETLDYQGKIDRSPQNINRLIGVGEAAAHTFLSQRAAAVSANPRLGGQA